MDLFDLSGKSAVVTGGSRGIGLMIARGLLEAGARVYISSRKADACAAAARELTRYGEVDARYDPEVIAYAYTGIGNFVGMRWADWTAGGRVPEDVLDDVLELLARGLAPRDPPAEPGPA